MKRRLSRCLAFVGAGAIALPAVADDLAEEGRKLAEEHCARCHVVGDYNPFGGIGSSPSFQLMVNHLDDWEARFMTFHQRHPHPPIVRIIGFPAPDPTVTPPNAAPFEIDLDDFERILAFASTLKED